jgi:hypothetical protein
MEAFNVKLNSWERQRPDDRAGHGGFERYDVIENVPWQSRSREPTAYEDSLAAGLEAAFKAGGADLASLADSLNTLGILRNDGEPWTESRLAAELDILGR